MHHIKGFLECTETTALCRFNVSFRWILHLECWHKLCHSVPTCSDVSPLIDILYFTGVYSTQLHNHQRMAVFPNAGISRFHVKTVLELYGNNLL